MDRFAISSRRVRVPPIQRVPAVNRLLEALPSIDRRRVLAECETVEQVFAEVLYTPGERLSHVYFPDHELHLT